MARVTILPLAYLSNLTMNGWLAKAVEFDRFKLLGNTMTPYVKKVKNLRVYNPISRKDKENKLPKKLRVNSGLKSSLRFKIKRGLI